MGSQAQCQVGREEQNGPGLGKGSRTGGWSWLAWVRSAAVGAMVAACRVITCGPCRGPRRQHGDRPRWEGHGWAEVELTSEASCWLFPCPGLPHHRCLPDPTESQGTPRFQVAWQRRPRERGHHWFRRPGFWNTEACGITAEGKLRPPGHSHWGHTVPRSFLTTKPWLSLCPAPWDPPPGAGQGWSSGSCVLGRWGRWAGTGWAVPSCCGGGGAWHMSQKPPLGLVLRLLRGHSGTVRALEAARPRPHPLPLSH